MKTFYIYILFFVLSAYGSHLIVVKMSKKYWELRNYISLQDTFNFNGEEKGVDKIV